MVTRTQRNATNPDLGVLSARLLFAAQRELFVKLAAHGFDDIHPRQGVVLAYLDPDGLRATEIARLAGQPKQAIGVLVDELEGLGYVVRKPDPADRRAKLVCPTERGLDQMRTADRIMASMQDRHARRVGREAYAEFKRVFMDVAEHQRRI